MRTRLVVAAAIALGATASFTGPAQATTADECQALVEQLRADTADPARTPSLAARARPGLVDKAVAAGTKLAAGKVADALVKLTDYDETLDALHAAAKPKVGDTDYLLLDGDVAAAIGCAQDIGTP